MTINFTFWLILCLSLSLAANFITVWYIRRVLGRLTFVNENMTDLSDLISTYQKHLSGIFSLEQYYGDQDIKYLLEHTKSLKEVLEEYTEVSNLLEPPDEIEEAEEPQGENQNAAPSLEEENVFYAGARASNS